MTSDRSVPRRYHSPLRKLQAHQTREVVIEAAGRLFAQRGWADTGMRDIARAAGVSVETVYATTGSKIDLLKLSLQIAHIGDDQPIPLVGRPAYAAISTGQTVRDRAAFAARMLAATNARIYRLTAARNQGAASDPEIAALAAEMEKQRRDGINEMACLIADHDVAASQIDELWVQCGDQVYAMLTNDCAWSTTSYESWLTGRIVETLARTTTHVGTNSA